MKLFEWWRRLQIFRRRDEWTEDLQDEMQLHVQLRARANRDRGMSAAEAELAAKLPSGALATSSSCERKRAMPGRLSGSRRPGAT
jgi:hypothetical protein